MPTINNRIYDEIPATWWDEDGFMALLRTAINPARFAYFHRVLARHPGLNNPAGLHVLDVGCGGGYLSEQFAALGYRVTGIDRSAPTLAAARTHAGQTGLTIRYLDASAEALPFAGPEFDVVCCCDVLEHVEDVDTVIGEIARVLKPGGLLLFDTINRTLTSKVVAIKMAQDWPPTRLLPRDVHVWEKFIRPDELAGLLDRHGLTRHEFRGLSPAGNPLRAASAFVRHKLGRLGYAGLGSRLTLAESGNLSISYMGFAYAPEAGRHD